MTDEYVTGIRTPSSARINIGFVAFCAAVAGIGGFLFGYDTAVINGANTFLQQHFHLNPDKDSLLIGLATASAIIGCVFGAMSAGSFSDRFGRRRVLFFCAVLYALSGILSAVPERLAVLTNLWHEIAGPGGHESDVFVLFILARILSGVAIGVSSMICPVYIAEIAPPAWRGRLGTLFQLGIVTGIFLTLFINQRIQGLGSEEWGIAYGWRCMLAAESLPAALFIFLLLGIPESPKWLIQAGRETEARATLRRIGGENYAEGEVTAVREVLGQEEGTFGELFSRRYRLPILIALVLMVGSQFSGINSIMYYSTEIFKKATGDADAGFKCSVWIGLVNLLATFVAIVLVDKAGRKPLLLVGNAIQVIALGIVGVLYASAPESKSLLVFVMIYTGSFAVAMGPLPWVVCSEIFPAKLRGRAMSIATFAIWTGCLLVAQSFPCLVQHPSIGPTRTFWIYSACSAITFALVLVLLPETKGKSLEEIEMHFLGRAAKK
jgi:MFS transporter, SP family, arabinose:H+ symporter